VALDGPKIKAKASKCKAMRYDRMAGEGQTDPGRSEAVAGRPKLPTLKKTGCMAKNRRGDELPEEL
jgi:hypothetical protein